LVGESKAIFANSSSHTARPGTSRSIASTSSATGYIALYRFDIQRDQVRVLALRHQREIGDLP
jgi:hypothetical protein